MAPIDATDTAASRATDDGTTDPGTGDGPAVEAPASELRERVRARYAAAAEMAGVPAGHTGTDRSEAAGGRLPVAEACCAADAAADDQSPSAQACCGPDAGDGFGFALYDDLESEGLPDPAQLVSLGCGNPTAVADLREGETVLDLGSGGGLDVVLSARRVGPTGFAYGLDMTREMLELARRNAAEAGATNVEFLEGEIEDIPLPDERVDVIISNCVVNLSVDKPAVMAEMARVLVPGGRLGVSDVVSEDRLTPAERAQRGSYVGCIAGALSVTEYREGLEGVGLVDVEVTFTHEVADGLHGAIVRARRPG
jgi:arsenite methyltransferase